MPRNSTTVTSGMVLLAVVLAGAACEPLSREPNPVLTHQESGTSARLQAVSAVNDRVAWASGVEGTYARTADGGATWTTGVVPGADSLQFRDVHAVDRNTAYLMSAGPGELSRIYKTTDAGETWTLQFTNEEPSGFFDCFDFWDPVSGVAFSDAVAGHFFIITTKDGETWQRVPPEMVPLAQPGEGSFAASGTCVTVGGDSTAWIGTGAAHYARVLKTTNRGRTWSAFAGPLGQGTPTSGVASIAFRDSLNGVAAGGEIGAPEEHNDNVAVTMDGGETWKVAGRTTFPGAVYGIAWVTDAPIPTLVAVGPAGADYSVDEGKTWVPLDSLDYWGIGFAGPRAGWITGPDGRVVKVSMF